MRETFWSLPLPPSDWVRIQTWIENLPDATVVVLPPVDGDADCTCVVDLGAIPSDGILRSIDRQRFEPTGDARTWAHENEIEIVEYGQHGVYAMMPETPEQKFAVRVRWF